MVQDSTNSSERKQILLSESGNHAVQFSIQLSRFEDRFSHCIHMDHHRLIDILSREEMKESSIRPFCQKAF